MVTAEQVKKAVEAAGITRIDHHHCAGCGHMVFYSISNGQLFFHPACGCVTYESPPEWRSWDHAADYINMQTRTGPHGDVAQKVASGFGLTLDQPE